jgi:DNA-binding NarL/FixJ family response regulator
MKRLLVVDDHDLFRQVLTVVLEEHTDLKQNVQASSLYEARLFLGDLNGEVSLAIVDLDLPEGEGTELIEDLRALDIPVLALTADRSLERRPRALRVRADEVLCTATSGEEILDTVNRLIGG